MPSLYVELVHEHFAQGLPVRCGTSSVEQVAHGLFEAPDIVPGITNYAAGLSPRDYFRHLRIGRGEEQM